MRIFNALALLTLVNCSAEPAAENKLEQAKANQETLALFYSALKDADAYIRLLFITGVSKFARVSLFSKLNNLIDLTFHKDFSILVFIF